MLQLSARLTDVTPSPALQAHSLFNPPEGATPADLASTPVPLPEPRMFQSESSSEPQARNHAEKRYFVTWGPDRLYEEIPEQFYAPLNEHIWSVETTRVTSWQSVVGYHAKIASIAKLIEEQQTYARSLLDESVFDEHEFPDDGLESPCVFNELERGGDETPAARPQTDRFKAYYYISQGQEASARLFLSGERLPWVADDMPRKTVVYSGLLTIGVTQPRISVENAFAHLHPARDYHGLASPAVDLTVGRWFDAFFGGAVNIYVE